MCFEILSEVDNLIEIDRRLISLEEMRNPDLEGKLKQLIPNVRFQKTDAPTDRPTPDLSKLWFPSPETSNDFSKLTPLQQQIMIKFGNFRDKKK